MRVICSIDTAEQPAFLSIFTGTVTPSYEDGIITNTANLEFYVTFEIRVYN
jgi:hypothetical protein